jgi:hypothetical protein
MMKNPKIILSCLISVMLATSASATWKSLTGNPVPISSLPDRTLIFGDKKISEIDVFGFGTGGVIAPNDDSIFVQGGYDYNDVTEEMGDYGLRFLLSWGAIFNQTVNADISFKISVLPGYDANYIKDVSMYLTGVSATGSGGVFVGETVWDAPFPGGNIIASLSCAKQANDGGAYLVDYAEFAHRKEIWIRSKDILISGGTSEIGTAHLSEVYQFYSQVPEPATLVLLGTAGVWIFTRKKQSLGGHKSK